jgi:hypothetical protein
MLPNHFPLNPNHFRSIPIIAAQCHSMPHFSASFFPAFFCTPLMPHAAQSFSTQSQSLPLNSNHCGSMPLNAAFFGIFFSRILLHPSDASCCPIICHSLIIAMPPFAALSTVL